MMKNVFIPGVFAIILIISGCDNLHGPKGNQDFATGIDLADVKYLCTSNDLNGESTNLYKITETNGEIVPVSFVNADLVPVDPSFFELTADEYYRLDEDLVCMTGKFEFYNDSSSTEKAMLTSILIDLNSGNISDFLGHYPGNNSYYRGSKYIQKDTLGNYFYAYNSKLYKLSRQGNGSFSIDQYIPDGQDFNDFYIDRKGNCFFTSYQNSLLKIKFASGGILISDYRIKDMFYDEGQLMAIYGSDVVKVKLSDVLSLEPVSGMQYDIEAFHYIYENRERGLTYLMQNAYSSSNSGYYGLVYVNELDGIRRLDLEIDGYDASGLNIVIGLKDHYLFMTSEDQSSVVRIDLDGIEGVTEFVLDQTVVAEVPDSYDIYSLQVADSNTIIFTGLNYGDEKIYVFEMDFNGNLTVISEIPSKSLVILDQIN